MAGEIKYGYLRTTHGYITCMTTFDGNQIQVYPACNARSSREWDNTTQSPLCGVISQGETQSDTVVEGPTISVSLSGDTITLTVAGRSSSYTNAGFVGNKVLYVITLAKQNNNSFNVGLGAWTSMAQMEPGGWARGRFIDSKTEIAGTGDWGMPAGTTFLDWNSSTPNAWYIWYYNVRNKSVWQFGVASNQSSINLGITHAQITGVALDVQESGMLPIDPYGPGEYTTPEVGSTSGDWTLPNDELALPGSSYSDLSAGLYRIYAMTTTQVNEFATQLWNTGIMDVISRFFEKPTDVVMGMYSYPFNVQSGSAESIYFNWISQWSTVDVTGHPVTQEIQHLEFGYADIPRYSGTFYDFQPYSVIQIHLPYIGFVEVKANEVVGKRVYLDYYVSLFSGDFTAALTVTGNNSPGLIGLYQGNIGRPVPLTQQDLFTLFKKGAELALTAAVAVGSGGVALAAGAEAAEAKVDMERRIEAGLPISAAMAANRYGAEQKTHDEALNVLKKSSVVGAANAMFGNPSGVAIIRNGAVDASSGRTSSQEAYILMTVPHQNVSSEQRLLGYPTNLPGPLSGYVGFTTVRDIRLDVPGATDSERAEIESIVRSGIII